MTSLGVGATADRAKVLLDREWVRGVVSAGSRRAPGVGQLGPTAGNEPLEKVEHR